MAQDDQTQPGSGEDVFAKPAAEARARQLAALKEHQVKPGQVLNKEGKNGHRARQELVADILSEKEDDPKAPQPGETRIRNVVLALARETYNGGPGAQSAGKTLLEQFAGKARQQLDLSSEDGSMSPNRKPTTAETRQELDRVLAALKGEVGEAPTTEPKAEP